MADQLHQGALRAPVGPFAVSADGHVADVSIDHPPSNIFDDELTVALRDLLDRCEADPDVRVLLFRSANSASRLIIRETRCSANHAPKTPQGQTLVCTVLAPSRPHRLRSSHTWTVSLP